MLYASRSKAGGRPPRLPRRARLRTWSARSGIVWATPLPRIGPGRPRVRPDHVLGDKGYSSKAIRTWLRRRLDADQRRTARREVAGPLRRRVPGLQIGISLDGDAKGNAWRVGYDGKPVAAMPDGRPMLKAGLR